MTKWREKIGITDCEVGKENFNKTFIWFVGYGISPRPYIPHVLNVGSECVLWLFAKHDSVPTKSIIFHWPVLAGSLEGLPVAPNYQNVSNSCPLQNI